MKLHYYNERIAFDSAHNYYWTVGLNIYPHFTCKMDFFFFFFVLSVCMDIVLYEVHIKNFFRGYKSVTPKDVKYISTIKTMPF